MLLFGWGLTAKLVLLDWFLWLTGVALTDVADVNDNNYDNDKNVKTTLTVYYSKKFTLGT